MKYWIRLLALLFAVILILTGLELLLPRSYTISASRLIEAAPEAIYGQIDRLPDWKSWSQWNPERIKDLTIDYGADGKSQRWTDVRGDGKLWITDQSVNQRVDYKVRFGNRPEMDSSIVLKPAEGGTMVSLDSSGVLPKRPLFGVFRHIYVNEMTKQYGRNLERLSEVVGGKTLPESESPSEKAEPAVAK
jgi:hypothetical protein